MISPNNYYTEDGEYVFSVSELNLNAKTVLEEHFQTVLVTGEISNFSRPASGHIYFSLKDETANIRCAWFRGRHSPLSFTLENGLHVIVMADVTIYRDRGEYQLVVRKVELAGAGLIKQKLEALKRKLLAEGLFAAEHKKPLPPFPKAIGVITSPTGAALQDVLAVLRRRAPFIELNVYPCQVQGAGAAETVVRALNQAIVEQKADVLILTRGGGSNEDLWAFNDERLAYAIYNCPLPLVSAVGHEVDLSIADFVADLRAPTPSAAAELVSPNIEDLYAYLNASKERMQLSFKRIYDENIKRIVFFSRLLVHPQQKIQLQQRLLQQSFQKLNKIIHNLTEMQKLKIDFVYRLIQKNNPKHKILSQRKQVEDVFLRLNEHAKKVLSTKKFKFSLGVEKLETLSPLKTLSRGYAILYSEKNNVLSDVNGVAVKEKITAQLTNGKLICKVEKIIK